MSNQGMRLALLTGMRSTSLARSRRRARAASPSHAPGERGSTLLEAVIGLGLIAVLLVTMASLIAIGRRVTSDARRQTLALALARTRLEQLQSLDFAREPLEAGGIAEVTDLVTDLSGPEPDVGGPGLAGSPADALVQSSAAYADRLDAQGRWLSRDERPAGAFVRRWRIERVGAGASELALIDVLVAPATTAERLRAAPLDVWLRDPDVVRLSGFLSRRAR